MELKVSFSLILFTIIEYTTQIGEPVVQVEFTLTEIKLAKDGKTEYKVLNPPEVENFTLKKDLLQTDCCYLLNCFTQLFLWIGKKSLLKLRNIANSAAKMLLNSSKSDAPNQNEDLHKRVLYSHNSHRS